MATKKMDTLLKNPESSHNLLIKILHCFSMHEIRRLALNMKCHPGYYEDVEDLPDPNTDIIPPTNDISDIEGNVKKK